MIDLCDYIVKTTTRLRNNRKEYNRSKYYRCYCAKCGKDRKYQSKSRYNKKPLCVKCASNTPEHRQTLKQNHWSRNGYSSPSKITDPETISKNKERRYRLNREYAKQHYQNNKEHIHRQRKYRLYSNINARLAANLRTRLRNAVKYQQKAGSAVRDLGCTIEELNKHLESRFQEGMSWDNWSKSGWHIDHIRPLSGFDLTDIEELKEACHYTNLQPLWAQDNLKKSDKDRTESI